MALALHMQWTNFENTWAARSARLSQLSLFVAKERLESNMTTSSRPAGHDAQVDESTMR